MSPYFPVGRGETFAAFFKNPMSSYTGVWNPNAPTFARFFRAATSWGRW